MIGYGSKGLTPSTLNDNLAYWTTQLRGDTPGKFGNDFVIVKESTVGNLATASSLAIMDYEEELLFREKNMNPYTAEDEYQDALFSLIGLPRTYADFTVVQRTVEGTPNTIASKGSILFQNKTTLDQFKLNDDCQIGENGKGLGSFTAEELGAIDLAPEALCEIITAPQNVVGVYYTKGNQIKIGTEYQSNAEYRAEWEDNQSLANSNTIDGYKKRLRSLVDNYRNIFIRQNRGDKKVYEDMPLSTINIVLNTAYDDETIAQTIFDKIPDGPGFVGNKVLIIKDEDGNDIEIRWDIAELIDIMFKVSVVLKDGYNLSQVLGQIKKAIKDNFNLYMGEDVLANKFYKNIYDVEGIDKVTDIKVKKNDDLEWFDVVQISNTQLAQSGDINVSN